MAYGKIRMPRPLVLAVLAGVFASLGPGGIASTLEVSGDLELIRIEPGQFQYRVSGAFLSKGRAVVAPLISARVEQPFEIMKYQVSVRDYARCVAAGICREPLGARRSMDDQPVTGVSYLDVQTYIRWLDAKTGSRWRLPTDLEWSYAAGDRFHDDAVIIDTSATSSQNDNPAAEWLARYEKRAALARNFDRVVRARGAFGANEHGIYDFSGNVWEWTSTCFERSVVEGDGSIVAVETENCGVRVVEGRHRTYITDFIRDAKAGGCSVGAPPDHLGFRLVKDATEAGLFTWIRAWWARLISGG